MTPTTADYRRMAYAAGFASAGFVSADSTVGSLSARSSPHGTRLLGGRELFSGP